MRAPAMRSQSPPPTPPVVMTQSFSPRSAVILSVIASLLSGTVPDGTARHPSWVMTPQMAYWLEL